MSASGIAVVAFDGLLGELDGLVARLFLARVEALERDVRRRAALVGFGVGERASPP